MAFPRRTRLGRGALKQIGTLILFNLGLIAFLTPVTSDPLVRQLDWPFLVVGTVTATVFLWRGRVGRSAGQLLLVASALFIVLHNIVDTMAQTYWTPSSF
jgi:Ca2+/Na+ antiporter